jgi:uncharacterized damage-inducible protein DinB
MHGTLNHLLTADWVWMHRFTGQGPSPDRLDAVQHERFSDLRAAREAEDRRIAAYIESLDEARLAGSIRYRRVSTPDEFVQPLMPALDHFFNQQTHHRGQAHSVLCSFGRATWCSTSSPINAKSRRKAWTSGRPSCRPGEKMRDNQPGENPCGEHEGARSRAQPRRRCDRRRQPEPGTAARRRSG